MTENQPNLPQTPEKSDSYKLLERNLSVYFTFNKSKLEKSIEDFRSSDPEERIMYISSEDPEFGKLHAFCLNSGLSAENINLLLNELSVAKGLPKFSWERDFEFDQEDEETYLLLTPFSIKIEMFP